MVVTKYLIRHKSSLFCRYFSSLQPAYILHPNVQTTNPQNQLLALTKSQIVPDPPKEFQKYYQTLDITPWQDTIRRNIIYARDFDTQAEVTPRVYPFGLFQNIIKILFSESPPNILPSLKNLHFIGNSEVTGTWNVQEKLFGVRGSLIGTLVKSKKEWPVFFEENIVEESKNHEIVSKTRDTFKEIKKFDIYLKDDNPPSYESKFPYVHTVVLIDNEDISEDQLLQKATVYLHSYLLKQAKVKFGAHENELPVPECAQAIITNGKRFSFLWYQLNTTSLNDLAEGKKNLLAIQQPGLLYTTISRLRDLVSHDKRILDDYNIDILKTFLAMFLWQQNN